MKFTAAAVASSMFLTPAIVSAQSVIANVETVTTTAATGKIVMYRGSSLMGAGLGCPFRYKGQEIVELGRGKYAEWFVPAGNYVLTNKTASVDLNVLAGQTKYVRCQIKPGFMTGRADFQVVDQESFAEHSADFEKKEVATVTFAAN